MVGLDLDEPRRLGRARAGRLEIRERLQRDGFARGEAPASAVVGLLRGCPSRTFPLPNVRCDGLADDCRPRDTRIAASFSLRRDDAVDGFKLRLQNAQVERDETLDFRPRHNAILLCA